jgi:hypothetical protein
VRRVIGLGSLVLLLVLQAAATAAPARPAPRPAAHAAGARRTASAPAAKSHAAAGTASRRLEDVNIEGELQVPQVLFVTARDPQRPLEFQHHRYLPTALDLGKTTPLPKWIALPQNPPASQGTKPS